MERWQKLLRQVMDTEPVAASAFASGKLVGWVDDRIVLGYPAGSFELQWAQDSHKLKAFTKECSRQAGRELTVQIRELRPEEERSPEIAQASAMQDQARKRAERARDLADEAKGHPVTRTLVEAFGATIDGITTEADES